MSVRNILDGTIPVGGSIGPGILDEVKTNSLTVGSPGMLCTGPMTCASTATIDTVNAVTSINTKAITVGSLNLFANDQVINEITQIDFTDGSRAITSVQAKVEATWLAITQNLHLFQLTMTKLTGMPATMKELTLTVPQIKPGYTFTLYDAVSVLVNDTPVLASLTIEATKDVSLVVTITFPTALENPSALSVRFLREMS